MLSIQDAADRSGRGAETIRRWIRSGRLRAQRDGRRLLIHEEDLVALLMATSFALPPAWATTSWSTAQPDWVGELRRHRGGRRTPS